MQESQNIPLTSAPAEKKRPSPVSTVNVVLGSSFNILKASMVSGSILPPKELRNVGRLNYAPSNVALSKI